MSSFLALLEGILLVPQAHALTLKDYVDLTVLNNSISLGGGSGFGAIFIGIAMLLRPFIIVSALIAITVMGVRMVIGQEDDAVDKAKTVIIACVSGIIVAAISPSLVTAFVTMQAGGVNPGGTQVVGNEIMGIINWGLGLAGVFAVFWIIVSALKAVSSPTSEDGISNVRQTVLNAIAGIVILATRIVITEAVGGGGSPNPNGIIAIGTAVVSALLGLVGLAAVAVVIYAGILMLVNFGNEERISQAKGLLTRAATGLVLIALSFAIVRFVVGVI